MKKNSLLYALIANFLRLPHVQRVQALSDYEVKSPGEFSLLRQTDTDCVGVKLLDEQEFALAPWMQKLRDLQSVMIGHPFSQAPQELDKHIAMGFEGSSNFIFQLNTEERSQNFVLTHYISSSSLLTQRKIAELIESLPAKQTAIKFITETLNKDYQLNDVSELQSKDLIELLKANKVFSLFGEDELKRSLVRDIQKALKWENQKFELDSEWGKYLTTYPTDDFMVDAGYFTGKATGKDIAQFIDAQVESSKLWRSVIEELNDFSDNKIQKEDFLKKDFNVFEIPTGNILQITKQHLEERGHQVNIPTELEAVVAWGPGPKDPLERRTWIPEEEVWHLQENNSVYSMYWLTEVSSEIKIKSISPSAEEDFLKALQEIELFAQKEGSPFIDQFRSAREILISEDVWKKIREEYLPTIEKLKTSQISEHKIRQLIAASCADVFGGMGSWNDQAFDGDEFHRVSNNLAAAMTELEISALN